MSIRHRGVSSQRQVVHMVEQIGDTRRVSAKLSYDSVENIIFMTFPTAIRLDTHEEISQHFERVVAFWRANARGRKCYVVVDFDNVEINPSELDFYAQESKRAHDLTTIAS